MSRPYSWPAVLFLLMRAPRTARELAGLTGAKPATVANYLKALEAEGLAKHERKAPRLNTYVWTWTPEGAR